MANTLDSVIQQVEALSSASQVNLDVLKARASQATSDVQNMDTVSSVAEITTSSLVSSDIAQTDSSYKHKEYYNKISAYDRLRDQAAMRTVSHNFAVEKLWMLCESGQKSETNKFVYEYCGKDYQWDEATTTEKVTEADAKSKFVTILQLDLQAQHDVNMTLLEIDHSARKQYLEEQLRLVEHMVAQQNTLVQSLKDWSHYMNQRADDYSKLYERLTVMMNTTKRKDVFEVKDLRALDGWNFFLTNVFWLVVVVFVVLIVVQHYAKLSARASQASSSDATATESN